MRTQTLIVLLALMMTPLTVYGYMGAADTPEEIDRIDKGEEPVIRLNPKDPTYDVWKHVRDDISKDRKPGPINVQRFNGHVPWVGIPTFFHLPVALTPADLKAGKVEVAAKLRGLKVVINRRGY